MERFLERIAKRLVYKADNADSIFLEWFYLFLLSVLNNIVYAFYLDQKALGKKVWLELIVFLGLLAISAYLHNYWLVIPAFAVSVFAFVPYSRNLLYLGTAVGAYLAVLVDWWFIKYSKFDSINSGFLIVSTVLFFAIGCGLADAYLWLTALLKRAKNTIKKILGFAVVMVVVIFASTNAFAFDPKHVEFYTYGGFSAVYDAFHFISLIFSDKSYKGLFFTVMALSLFFAGFRNYIQSLQGRQTGNILSWSMPVLIAFVLYMALIVPKGQVTIYDTVLNKSADVGGIPIGITTVAGIASEVENGIIKIIDTTEINPDLNYENSAGGVGVMSIMNMALHGVRSNNVYLDRSLKRYVEDCVFYDLENPQGKTKLSDITDTTESFTQVLEKASRYQSIYTVYYDANHNAGETMTCYQAWQNLKPQLLNNNNFQSALDDMCATVGIDTTDTVALQHCEDVLTAYIQDLYDGKFSAVTSDAFSFIRQAYVANEIYRASVDADSSFLINYRIANTGMNIGMAFNTWIPTIRAVLIALGLSILPFLIIFLPTPFYGKIIGAVVGVFVFMVSWAMLDAIVHHFLVGEAQTLFQSAVIHNVGYGAFLTMSTPLQHIMAMWGYVRSLAMGIAAISTGIFTKVGAYGLQMAIGRLEGAVASQASTIGEQATNPAEQGNLEKSIAMSSAFSQKIAPSVTLQDIIRGEANVEAKRIGSGLAAHDVNEALNAGKIEGNYNIGRDFQLQDIANRATGGNIREVGAMSTQMTTGTQIKEALDVDQNNPMAAAEEISSTNAKVAAGSVLAWNKLQEITDKSIKKMSEDTQVGKVVHSMADYDALKNTGFKKSMDYLAINELNQFRQNRGFVQLFQKAGLLSKDFYNKSPEGQIEELKGAFDHLGSHPENIPIGADLARRLGLRGAGTYTIGMTPDGRYVQIVGKSGANFYDVRHGFEEVGAAQIINGRRIGKPVLLRRTSGESSVRDNSIVDKSGYVYQDGQLTVEGTEKSAPAYAVGYGWVGEELDQLNRQFNAGVSPEWIHALKGVSGNFVMRGKTIQVQGVVSGDKERELGKFLKEHGLTKAGGFLINAANEHKAAQVDMMISPKGLAASVAVGNKEVAESVNKSIKDTQNVSKYGTNVDLGNAIDAYVNPSVSTKQLTQELLKPNMIGFMRTNNEDTFLAGASAFFNKVLSVVDTKYGGKSTASTAKTNEEINRSTFDFGLGLSGGGSGVSPGIGWSTSHIKQTTKRSGESQDSDYNTTVDSLRENFRKEAIQIYDITKNIENPTERAQMRASLLASAAEMQLSSAELNQKLGVKASTSADVDVPTLRPDDSGKPLPTDNVVQDFDGKTKLIQDIVNKNKRWSEEIKDGQ